jgi:hypothetical protein
MLRAFLLLTDRVQPLSKVPHWRIAALASMNYTQKSVK